MKVMWLRMISEGLREKLEEESLSYVPSKATEGARDVTIGLVNHANKVAMGNYRSIASPCHSNEQLM